MKKLIFTAASLLLLLFVSPCAFADEASLPAIVVSYADIQCNTVNLQDTAEIELVTIDSSPFVKVTPNPQSKDAKVCKIDAYTLNTLGIDLDKYKYLLAEYKCEGDKTEEYLPIAHYKTNGDILKPEYTQSALTEPKRIFRRGEYFYALFDFNFVDEMMRPDTSHVLRQMHYLPYGNKKLSELTTDNKVYIGRMAFLTEDVLSLERNSTIIEGFPDGSFRPNDALTLSQGIAISARLLGFSKVTGTESLDGHWYDEYLDFCLSEGILESAPQSPDRPMTITEFSHLLQLSQTPKEKRNGAFYETADGNVITRAMASSLIKATLDAKGEISASDSCVFVYTDVSRLDACFEDVLFVSSHHVSVNQKLLYYISDRGVDASLLPSADSYCSVIKGNDYIKELDIYEQERIAEIRATASLEPSGTGKVYYVANDGNDTASGLSRGDALESLTTALAIAVSGDTVLLKRNDLFRGHFRVPAGVTLGAYGDGDKPKVYGSPQNGANPSLWTLIYENNGAKIWKFANEKMMDVGNIIIDEGRMYGLKDIPTWKNGMFVCREDESVPYDYLKELDVDLNFFHDAKSNITASGLISSSSTGPLYFRCDAGNPGSLFDSIEFAERGNAVGIGGNGVTINNLCIMYTGSHGVGAGTVSDLTVTDCEVGWIGGSVQHYNNNGKVTRFGNGVEIYGGCDGYLVENCYVYQCYDAGVTHQFDGNGEKGDYVMYNVLYKNNLITDCVYSIEYFFTEAPGKIRDGNNIVFDGNVMRRCGFGFGSTRPNGHAQRHIRCNPYGNPFRNFVIKNNVLDRSVADLLRITVSKEEYFPTFQGNIFVVGIGNDLCTYGYNNGITYPADYSSIFTIRSILKDMTATLYFTDKTEYYEYEYNSYM